MRKLTRDGFTFVELLVALVLMGIVSSAIFSLMRNNQKIYAEQTARIELNQNTRAIVGILPTELRELDATDADIIAMGPDSLRYNAMRSTYILCQPPDSVNLKVVVSSATWYGLSPLTHDGSFDATDVKFLLYNENNFNTRSDDAWNRVGASAIASGSACPTAGASYTLTLTGTSKSQLSSVLNGAPLRAYKPTTVSSYEDANGDYWVGLKTQNVSDNSWGAIQPMAGPITSGGLVFTYYKADGTTTTDPLLVTRIGIAVTGRTQEKVRARGGAQQYVTTGLGAQAAVRNNRRW
jgi:prepilin-type N-terminal cleavage/methylation domain-containing protein